MFVYLESECSQTLCKIKSQQYKQQIYTFCDFVFDGRQSKYQEMYAIMG